MKNSLVAMNNLSIDYFQGYSVTHAVKNVSLEIAAGETLGIVGESGCGKSTLALALAGLLPKNESRIVSGDLFFQGENMMNNSDETWRALRGKKIAMIFQDPFSSLNPVLTVGYQIMETLALDGETNPAVARALLEKVQIEEPERILRAYPHQISGGQRQRVMIAIALARKPVLLLADEPTTALDVTVQDEILKLLIRLQKEMQMTMLFVTHNIGIVKQVSTQLAVMKEGQIVEVGDTRALLSKPSHPYTKQLLGCILTLQKSK